MRWCVTIHTFHMLDYAPSMHPIGAQLCGSKPALAGPAARIIEDLGFDVVDLNCGCPVDKVTKDGSGSGMLKTPEIDRRRDRQYGGGRPYSCDGQDSCGWDEESINAPQSRALQNRRVQRRSASMAGRGSKRTEDLRTGTILRHVKQVGQSDQSDWKWGYCGWRVR